MLISTSTQLTTSPRVTTKPINDKPIIERYAKLQRGHRRCGRWSGRRGRPVRQSILGRGGRGRWQPSGGSTRATAPVDEEHRRRGRGAQLSDMKGEVVGVNSNEPFAKKYLHDTLVYSLSRKTLIGRPVIANFICDPNWKAVNG